MLSIPLGHDCSTRDDLFVIVPAKHTSFSHWSCDMNHAIIRTRLWPRQITDQQRSDAGAKRWLNHWQTTEGWSVSCGGPSTLSAAFLLSASPLSASHPSRPFHSISLSISVLLCSFLFHRLSVFYSSAFFPPVRDTRYFLYSSSLSCFKLALWKVNPSPGIPFSLPLSFSASLLRFIHPLSRCSYSCLYLFCHQLGLLRCSELYHPLFFSLFYYPVTFIHVMAVMGICTLQKETQVVMIPRSCALPSGATPILLLHQGRFRLNCCILDANKCFVPFLFFLLLVLFFKL